ncbi:IS3 family transposase [Chimaeribacter californicus]|uniref:IS3 family transposase n=1 Tax=Chimaeribacter californicus TaxID=2060067 RepID=UPI003B9854BD
MRSEPGLAAGEAERIKKKIYGTREEARRDIFDYFEMFYNSKRQHGSGAEMSSAEYGHHYFQRPGSVWIMHSDSKYISLYKY